MPLNEDMQTAPSAQGPSDQQVSTAVQTYMSDHAADFKGSPGKDGQNATDTQVNTAVQTYMTANASLFKGKDGTDGLNATPAQISTAVTAYMTANAASIKGAKGDPGDSYVKVRSKVSVAAQSTSGTYTLPAINFGANKFTQSPVISCDIECAANSNMLGVTWTTGGTAATGFTMTPTVKAMNTTVTLSVLGTAVNLLTTVPACTLHITASEPS